MNDCYRRRVIFSCLSFGEPRNFRISTLPFTKIDYSSQSVDPQGACVEKETTPSVPSSFKVFDVSTRTIEKDTLLGFTGWNTAVYLHSWGVS